MTKSMMKQLGMDVNLFGETQQFGYDVLVVGDDHRQIKMLHFEAAFRRIEFAFRHSAVEGVRREERRTLDLRSRQTQRLNAATRVKQAIDDWISITISQTINK